MRLPSSFRRAVPLAAAALMFAACNARMTGPAGPTGPLAVKVSRTQLSLVNRGDRPVYTFVIERETRMLADWAACADPAHCPSLAPGATQVIPFTEGNRLAPGREALVNWWYSVSTPDGYRPDSIRTFVVRL